MRNRWYRCFALILLLNTMFNAYNDYNGGCNETVRFINGLDERNGICNWFYGLQRLRLNLIEQKNK